MDDKLRYNVSLSLFKCSLSFIFYLIIILTVITVTFIELTLHTKFEGREYKPIQSGITGQYRELSVFVQVAYFLFKLNTYRSSDDRTWLVSVKINLKALM